jgi:hypothetical protein
MTIRTGYLSTELGGAMDLNEEYRWNVPVIYYGFDETFLAAFGHLGFPLQPATIVW